MEWLPAILIIPYFLLLIRIFLGLLKIRQYKSDCEPDIFVSVVVAYHNEQDNLPDLLNYLMAQNHPHDKFEVIIVDDNSTDNTKQIASRFTGLLNLVSIPNKGTGKKQAVKTGIEAASGNLIITTDADCRMGKNWIRSIAQYFSAKKPSLVICPVSIEPSSGFFGRFQELEFLSLQGVTAGTAMAGDPVMCNGANLAFPKDAYLNNVENLHFDVGSGDDIFLLHSIKQLGRQKILWLESGDALVTTGSVPDITSFLKQRNRWISKWKNYSDPSTILMGIVTFVTILIQLIYCISAIIDPHLIPVLITILLLKFIPDYLILLNTSTRYGRRKLMNWFLPAQIIYPFYVIGVIVYSVFRNKGNKS
jgi:biofilm PGA synthesis N-glycosyltransferase PgaC